MAITICEVAQTTRLNEQQQQHHINLLYSKILVVKCVVFNSCCTHSISLLLLHKCVS